MRTRIALFLIGIAIGACTEEQVVSPPAPDSAGTSAVVFEAGPRVTQCAAPVISLSQSAARLSNAGLEVRRSSCGIMTGVAFPAVCGAGTAEILVHDIPASGLTAAAGRGFRPVDTLVDPARATGWRRISCGGYQPYIDLAKQSAGCAQFRNRLLTINHSAQLDLELILLDQQGSCADAAYRQLLLGESVDDVLCSNAQTIAGPVKQCRVPRYAALFDTIIANLDKPDLGLGAGFEITQLAL